MTTRKSTTTTTETRLSSTMNPDLRAFIDRAIVPALVERFLREQAATGATTAPVRPAA
jgi:hypothetical protein